MAFSRPKHKLAIDTNLYKSDTWVTTAQVLGPSLPSQAQEDESEKESNWDLNQHSTK